MKKRLPSPWRQCRLVLGAACLAITAAAAHAAPAPWYLWRSVLNGHTHCAQASPGAGWERVRGPYADLRCSRPASGAPQQGPSPPPQPSGATGRPVPAQR